MPLKIEELGKYYADRNRRRDMARAEQQQQKDLEPLTPVVTYEGYDADSEQHLVRGINGVQGVKQMLTTAGLDAGDRVEFQDGALDSTPHYKAARTDEPVLADRELTWGVAYNRHAYIGLLENGEPRYETQLWLITATGSQKLLTIADITSDTGASVPPQHQVYLAIDAQGIFYFDVKIAYPNAETVFSEFHHLIIQNGSISTVEASQSWRRFAANSPDYLPLAGEGSHPCVGAYQEENIVGAAVERNRNLDEQTGRVTYPIFPDSQDFLSVAAFRAGTAVEIRAWTLRATDLNSNTCSISTETPDEAINFFLPPFDIETVGILPQDTAPRIDAVVFYG